MSGMTLACFPSRNRNASAPTPQSLAERYIDIGQGRFLEIPQRLVRMEYK